MASTFAGVDFYDIDGLLSEEERAVRDTVRAWVDEHLMPVIGEAYIEGEFPKQLIPGMAELGLFGANLPEEYGCAGLNNVAYGLIMQELERGDSGHPLVRLGAGRPGDVSDLRLRLRGAEAALAAAARLGQGDRLLRPDRARLRVQPGRHDHHREAKRRTAGCSTAPRCGSPTARRRTVAIVWAKTGAIDDPRSIRGFIVPTNTKGFTAKDQKGKLSLRASDTSEIVPAGRAWSPRTPSCPKSGGIKSPLMCLTQARYGIAWGGDRRGDGLLRRGAELLRSSRIMFGKPIGQTQLAAGAAGRDADRDHQGAAAARCSWAGSRTAGTMTPEQVSLAKRNNVEHGLRVPRARRAACWAPTASWPSTTRCGTWPTSSRCTRTRARTTCTR